ncbi:hypothetical protein NESM_000816100 [Novymonas esmeraldas]|uniref:Rab3-GAP regulatory subunit N-terminal domain-containing protein n=1 Tax=Novymonas esmeraldas TaxID=1808958 RepID=A0AAW0EZ19_9TRYP
MQDQWMIDGESEDHRSRRDMTEKSIARHVKGEMERQVTSSSTSSAVFVCDGAWITAASIAQPSYLCCGLSNGSVCLLNTSNLSKIYLFELSRDGRGPHKDKDRTDHGRTHGAASQQLVAVATHALPATAAASTSALQVLLCTTLDGAVCVCPMDMSSVLERKKVSRSDMARVKLYPAVSPGAVLHASVQFNAAGNRIVAMLAIAQEESSAQKSTLSTRYRIAVLTCTDATVTLQSRYTSEGEWHTLAPPAATGRVACPGAAVELCYCGWWSADTLVCVWSDSLIQLLLVPTMRVVGECRLLRHCAADAVTLAKVSRPSVAETVEGHSKFGLVAVVLENNIAACFHVTVRYVGAADDREVKRHRGEALAVVSVVPTMQTYCTEDIPVRELHLARSFAWTVVLLLESGAIVFLDAETMRLSVHRAVNRLRAPDAARYEAGGLLTAPRHFFCLVSGRPFSAAVVEHNAAILLKAQ